MVTAADRYKKILMQYTNLIGCRVRPVYIESDHQDSVSAISTVATLAKIRINDAKAQTAMTHQSPDDACPLSPPQPVALSACHHLLTSRLLACPLTRLPARTPTSIARPFPLGDSFVGIVRSTADLEWSMRTYLRTREPWK